MRSWRSVSEIEFEREREEGSRAVVREGWEMEFWPVIVRPLVRPTEMWWVKFVFMAGRTDVWLGTEQMLDRRYMADSKEPVKRRALGLVSGLMFCYGVADLLVLISRVVSLKQIEDRQEDNVKNLRTTHTQLKTSFQY